MDEDPDGEDMQGVSSNDQMVKKLVRLALASEYSRIPIRRSDISAKGLGMRSRSELLKLTIWRQS